MPRLPRALLRQARAINTELPSLLPVCRALRSAQNELRWLTDHAHVHREHGLRCQHGLLKSFVARRARGEPLQYILGTEYFGDLEIKCRPGVLIPRQETAASVTRLVQLLSGNTKADRSQEKLRVMDLCTGCGCIPLLFHHEFYSRSENRNLSLDVVSIDLSQNALKLAHENLKVQMEGQGNKGEGCTTKVESLTTMRFLHADVLKENDEDVDGPKTVIRALQQFHGPGSTPKYDILISNPPYISSKSFRTTTSRSVRRFEPKLALVPNSRSLKPSLHDGDVFYPRLLDLAQQLSTKIVLFEVADMSQAERVAGLAVKQGVWDGIEIWRDEPGASALDLDTTSEIHGAIVKVRGAGNGRSVFAYRGAGAAWLRQ